MFSLKAHLKVFRHRTIVSLRDATNAPIAQTVRRLLPAPIRSLLHRLSKRIRSQPIHLMLPRTPAPEVPVRVVIYGTFANDWIPRLADADTWRALADVTEVLILPDPTGRQIPLSHDPRSRTVLIPLSEDDIVRCPRTLPTLAPTPRAVDTLRDKASFTTYADAVGLAAFCPAVYRSPDEVRLPCVVKPVRAEFGTGVRILRSREQLDSFVAAEGWNPSTYICQEFLGGNVEYVTHCILERGRLLWSCTFAFELPEGIDIRRGVAYRVREVTPPDALLDVAARLLGPLAYSGPCNLDYKLVAPDRIAIFEINPRLGGSLMLAHNRPKLQAALRCIIDHAA